ncbi:hypothetical protein EEDFHM_02103 [Methylorubrum populi]
MPRLVLTPMPQPTDGGICVGTLDGEPCTFYGRTATAGGREHEMKAISVDILEAVDVAAKAVFGPEWVQALALVTSLNPRTCQRDRIGRYGLPAPILRALGEAAAFQWPRALGDVMLATSRLAKVAAGHGGRRAPPGGSVIPPDFDVTSQMGETVERGMRLVAWLAQERSGHRAPALDDDA